MCRLELSRNCEGEHCSVLVTAWRVSGKGFLKSGCLPCRLLRSALISWQLNKSQNIFWCITSVTQPQRLGATQQKKKPKQSAEN